MDHPTRSTKNPVVRRFRRVADGDESDLMVAEGTRLVTEALDAECEILELAWSPRLLTRTGGEALLDRLRIAVPAIHDCGDRVLKQLSHLTTHQGVSVIVRRPGWREQDLLGSGNAPLVVVAAGIRDPGNLGAIMRTAEAADATGLIAAAGSADPFRDKAARGSAGSVFRFPCLSGFDAAATIEFAKRNRLRVVVADGGSADGESETVSWDCDLRGPTLLVFGAEGAGVPAAFLEAAEERVKIPIAPNVESLNVSVAAGVLLFDAKRQRRREGTAGDGS